jgi:hypothetical protein
MDKRLFIAVLLIWLVAALGCGPARKFENSVRTYEDTVLPVKNILLIIRNANISSSYYKTFETHLNNQLNARGVNIRYLYLKPGDPQADAQIADTVHKYQFDFIIKQRLKVLYNTDNGTAITYDSRTAKLSNVLGVTMRGINANYIGFRKKQQYSMVWSCNCDVPNGAFPNRLTENAATCITRSLSEIGLVPADSLQGATK